MMMITRSLLAFAISTALGACVVGEEPQAAPNGGVRSHSEDDGWLALSLVDRAPIATGWVHTMFMSLERHDISELNGVPGSGEYAFVYFQKTSDSPGGDALVDGAIWGECSDGSAPQRGFSGLIYEESGELDANHTDATVIYCRTTPGGDWSSFDSVGASLNVSW